MIIDCIFHINTHQFIKISQKLRIAEQDPILKRKRFVYDVDGKPVEYNVGYYKADSFTYTITSER